MILIHKKKMSIKFGLAFLFSGLSFFCNCQVVDVDTYTGKAIVTIPIWTIKSGSLTFPITLAHASGGIKADTPTGLVGTGWSISSGGSITREVRGLPDDCNLAAVGGTPAKQGWLTNNISSTIGGFVPAADENLSVATDEQADYDFLNSLGGFTGGTMKDTEPDIFFINAPGIGSSFVHNNNGQISFLGKQDFKVTSTTGTDGKILGFTVIDDGGVTYIFGDPLSGSTLAVLTDAANVAHGESEITHFRYEYYLYKTRVFYNATWKLLSIQSPNGDKISFEYNPLGRVVSTITVGGQDFLFFANQQDEVNAYLYNEATGSTIKKFQYTMMRSVVPTVQFTKAIGKIETAEIVQSTIVMPQGDYELKQQLIGSIDIYDTKQAQPILERQFKLDYGIVRPNEGTVYDHIFLKSLRESSTIKSWAPYVFEYNGVNFATSFMNPSGRNDSFRDEFGFINAGVCCESYVPYSAFLYPALSGIDRVRNSPLPGYAGTLIEISGRDNQISAPQLLTSTLSKIILPSGGSNRIFYEPNLYRDPTSLTDTYGGGVRVSRLEYHDGVDYANDITKYFRYEQDDGTSSGALLYRPLRTFNLNAYKNQQTGVVTYYHELLNQNLTTPQVWKRTIVSSDLALNTDADQGAFVGYKKVSVSQAGIGKTVYEYDMPGAFGNTAEVDWAATKNKIARKLPPAGATNIITHDMGPITGYYSYPFAPNPNYDHKRGLLKRTSAFSSTNALVEQTDYEYTYLTTPTKVYGIRLDQYNAPFTYTQTLINNGVPATSTALVGLPMFIYNRYEMNTNMRPRLWRTTHKIVDQNNASAFISSVESLEYTSTAHDRVTKKTQLGSDGVEFSTNYKYPVDYTITAPWAQQDNMAKAITKLKEKNIFLPIETWATKKEGAETPLVTSAHLGLFEYNALSNTVALKKDLSMATYSPVSFVPSSITNNGTTSVFTYQTAKYNRFTDFSHPDNLGNMRSTTAFNKTKSGTHYAWNSATPKLTITKALADEAAYSDFESFSDYDFAYIKTNWGTTALYASGRVAGNSLNMLAGPSYKITKSLTKGQGQQSVFSCWIKSATAGSLTIRVNDGGAHLQVSVTLNFAITPSWKYYSVKVPTATFNPTITVEAETNVPINLDDALFCPAQALPTTYLYGTGLSKLAETDARGVSTYYEYDDFNRLRYVRDQDQNILKSNSYKIGGSQLQPTDPTISVSGDMYPNRLITFNAENSGDVANTIYKWKIVKLAEYQANNAILTDFSNAIVVNGSNQLSNYTFIEKGNWIINLQIIYQGVIRMVELTATVSIVNQPLSVSICSNRPLRIDACNPVPLLLDCNPLASTTGLVLVANVASGSGSYSYNWTKTPDYLTTGTSQGYTVTDYLITRTYTIVVTDNVTGDKGTANITFEVYKSDPLCPNTSSQ